jgi:hypothetical protein
MTLTILAATAAIEYFLLRAYRERRAVRVVIRRGRK